MRSFYPFTAVVTLVAAGGALASALSQPSANPFSSPNNTTSSPTSSSTGSPNPNAPVCGAGFTYCGYILRDHKNFNEDDIVNTYCEAHKDNCVNGRAKTDPLQALYICLPSNANPLEAWADSSSRVVSRGISHNHNDKQNQHQQPVKVSLSDRQVDHLHQNNKNNNNNNNHPKSTHRMLPNLHIISKEEDGKPSSTRQAPTSVQPPETPHSSSSSSSSQEPPSAEPPQAPQPSQSSINSSSSNNGGDSCASSLTLPGNKIELLCSCGRQCLNPLSDHIARCDGRCSS